VTEPLRLSLEAKGNEGGGKRRNENIEKSFTFFRSVFEGK